MRYTECMKNYLCVMWNAWKTPYVFPRMHEKLLMCSLECIKNYLPVAGDCVFHRTFYV